MSQIEFFFDCSSPWTYLAFSRIRALADRYGAKLIYRPILVGGVFNAVNQSVYEQRAAPVPAKARYMRKDMADWAALYGLKILWPPSVFPVRAVDAMRAVIAADEKGALEPFAWAVFKAYWGQDQDISKQDVLAAIAGRVGLDAGWLLERTLADVVKGRLKANTEELIARGGFGSPTLFVDESDMYFGNDRLPLVEAALIRGKGGTTA